MQDNKSKLNIVLAVLIVLLLAVLIFRTKDSAVAPVENPNNVEPVGQPVGIEVLGMKDDLMYSSIKAGDTVSGNTSFSASVKGGYFFEANIVVNILDANKNVLKKGNAMAIGEWMKSGPVPFEMELDFTNLKKGPGYIQIKNDNASGLPENDKEILIPVLIN